MKRKPLHPNSSEEVIQMTESEYSALVRYMQEQRTQTAWQVGEIIREHDNDDFTAQERQAQFGA
ncbi:MAG: hypothetical protein ABR585_12790 [Gemmatimonadaceae bacterium]|nr:hypothetical protein [Actinomycetota bacterium]